MLTHSIETILKQSITRLINDLGKQIFYQETMISLAQLAINIQNKYTYLQKELTLSDLQYEISSLYTTYCCLTANKKIFINDPHLIAQISQSISRRYPRNAAEHKIAHHMNCCLDEIYSITKHPINKYHTYRDTLHSHAIDYIVTHCNISEIISSDHFSLRQITKLSPRSKRECKQQNIAIRKYYDSVFNDAIEYITNQLQNCYTDLGINFFKNKIAQNLLPLINSLPETRQGLLKNRITQEIQRRKFTISKFKGIEPTLKQQLKTITSHLVPLNFYPFPEHMSTEHIANNYTSILILFNSLLASATLILDTLYPLLDNANLEAITPSHICSLFYMAFDSHTNNSFSIPNSHALFLSNCGIEIASISQLNGMRHPAIMAIAMILCKLPKHNTQPPYHTYSTTPNDLLAPAIAESWLTQIKNSLINQHLKTKFFITKKRKESYLHCLREHLQCIDNISDLNRFKEKFIAQKRHPLRIHRHLWKLRSPGNTKSWQEALKIINNREIVLQNGITLDRFFSTKNSDSHC